MKRPAFQFYPADWRKDAALQSCSLVARGLWLEMLCVMHECAPYGHLVVNGKGMTAAQLGRLVGLSDKECTKLMHELEGAGVYSRDAEGIIFSRRMVKDERLRNVRAEAGKLGGNPLLLGIKDNQKDNHTNNRPDNLSDKQTPTPSSAFAFASASSSLKPAVALPPTVTRQQTNGHSMDKKSVTAKGKTPENWRSIAWVTATARTLGIPRIPGENDDGFMDRVHTAANSRRIQAGARR